eukprot:CAMPEP_0183744308 /NCGR_PEP_ID=MMETSP0737-20130205/65663_1 /TAXON_ID=385413 /ORGANISM="Thalassiosira miniscula, Strain CCMP1093" /LENGTH=931 /DNA_ID=CAMNT_0025979947 /DNA_START=589 /DNA_END=3384 /DNA_ORIENTATION=-
MKIPPLLLPLLTLLAPQTTHAILPTAAIDIFLPDVSVSDAITLYASQASFGGDVAAYNHRHSHFEEAGSSGKSRIDGIGVVPAFPPSDDEYLCNESDGLVDYSNKQVDVTYVRSALLVPRGQCSFERKALSAQRLGASAIVIYGTLSSRYSLNYTNSTACVDEGEGCDGDAKTRTDYTLGEVLWPQDKLDYDCDFGKAYLPSLDGLDFTKMPGGYNMQNDGMLMGRSENNLCVKHDAAAPGEGTSFASGCESQRCLVTGNNVTGSDGSVKYEACCAWDLHVWLYGDSSIHATDDNDKKGKEEGTDERPENEVTIPAVFITMEEASELLDLVRGASSSSSAGGGDPVSMSIYQRHRPEYNVSAVLIWAFGVFVAWIASYNSSAEIRSVSKAIVVQREVNARNNANNTSGGSGGGNHQQREHQQQQRRTNTPGSTARPRSRSNSPSSSAAQNATDGGALEMSSGASNAATTTEQTQQRGEERTIYQSQPDNDAAATVLARGDGGGGHNRHHHRHDEESLELTASHAVGFLVMASTSLLVLFFFKIYNLVKVMYAFGCSGAFAQIMVHPGLTKMCQKLRWDRPLNNIQWLNEESATREALRGGCKGHCMNCLWSFFGPITPVDVAAMILSYGVGAVWLWVAFTVPHPDTVAFYWLVQDIFGLCMCMLFLETIKLNAIKVGAVLLIVAFFYDIFFVFVTPLLTKHGESIMVNVATSGGPPKADPSWCEKYPFSADCKGGDPLPMLFAIPRVGDYQGGCSMLGLGDIVLPGLLLSFASRYDESKRLMGLISGGSGRVVNNACPDAMGAGNRSKSANPFCALCCCCCRAGYFGPVMVGYAVGLLMANAAVYIMEMGQPALLYLVPCCLGTMVYMGHKAGELNDLWEGPRVIRAVDALMYGEPPVDYADEEVMEEEQREERLLENRMENEEGGLPAMT